jgi:hypothetical protein
LASSKDAHECIKEWKKVDTNFKFLFFHKSTGEISIRKKFQPKGDKSVMIESLKKLIFFFNPETFQTILES